MDDFISTILPPIAQGIMDAFASQQLPVSDDVSNWALEKERKIYLDTDVDDSMLAIQRLILRWNIEDRGVAAEDRKPIWIYIMSYGGELDNMWMVIDAIQTSATPVYTVNLGIAGSAASLIFLSGHKRFMMPRAKLIVHEGSAQLSGDAVKVMDQSESYKKQLKQMKEFIFETTEIPRTQLMKKRNNDWELDAQYCLEHKACEVIANKMEDII